MEIIEIKRDGRLYAAYKQGDLTIIIGPPEGIVDDIGLPKGIATRLHNILYHRKLYNYAAVAKNSNQMVGALQEALSIDVQKLNEAYFRYDQEVSHE